MRNADEVDQMQTPGWALFLLSTRGDEPTESRQRRGVSPGFRQVTSDMLCVLTRTRLKHCWHLIPAYIHFRRIARQCRRHVPGLLRFAFTVESLWTFYTISIWRSEDAIPLFGNIPDHVVAARWTFQHAREIWSAEWSISGLSPRTRWNGQDLIPEDLVLVQQSTEGESHG